MRTIRILSIQAMWLCLGCLLLAGTLAAHGAQGRSSLNAQRRNLGRAASELRGARLGWATTRKELLSAESAYLRATNTFQAARRTASQLHSTEMGLTAAIADRDDAAKELNTTREAVMKRIKSRTDYQAAVQQAEAASKRLAQVRADPLLDATQRERLIADLTTGVRLPMELQHQWLTDDPKLLEATRRLAAAEQKVVHLQPPVTRAVESDPEVVKARDELKNAETALDKARKDTVQAQKDLSSAQISLDRETRQYQQSVARERGLNRSGRRSRR